MWGYLCPIYLFYSLSLYILEALDTQASNENPLFNHVLIWFYSLSLYKLEAPDTQASNENPYLNHVLIWFYSRSLYTLETPDTQASNENLLFKSCDLYSLLLLVELLYRPVWRYQPSLSLQVWFKRATRIFTSKQSTLLKITPDTRTGFHIYWFSSDSWAVHTCWHILCGSRYLEKNGSKRGAWRKSGYKGIKR